MTNELRKDPRKNFVPRIWPWLLALLMLGVYGLTLNHWVSLLNMETVARVSGWKWQPEVDSPLVYLATCPLRLLPTGVIPVALNLLSAVCAAFTLGLLARTVAILPQDRTEAQRVREHSDFSFLTTGTAWLPPLFAVLVCGLHFNFWEQATNFTGDSLDLLVFAFVVWALVEYRLDEEDGRLLAAMFLYGADMAGNFAMIGFLPILIGALIWIRGLGFFNIRFLIRLLLCGLAGTLLYFLLPTVAVVSGAVPGAAWWQLFKVNISSQFHVLQYFANNTADSRHNLYLISMTTLLPVLLMSFRWRSSFGDRSKLGSAFTGWMIHAVYGVMLFIGVWGMFDPPFSARHLGSGLAFSTFYYLLALSLGYYSGYFLLISKMATSRSSRRRKSALAQLPRTINPIAVIVVALLALAATAGLVYKNGPAIRSINSGILQTYARLMAAHLPRGGGILLSDNEMGAQDTPRRLYLVQEELVQEGRENEYVPVDTTALNWPEYHRYLHRKHPQAWPLLVNAKSENMLNPQGLLSVLNLLSKSNNIYYLHPSFGYYFEVFYPEPHGLVYQLKPLPEDTLRPPPADAKLVKENEDFWRQAESEAFGPIFADFNVKPAFEQNNDWSHHWLKKLHIEPEPNKNAELAGLYYSRSLDFWGVQAQRAHELPQAEAHFMTALRLNPDNPVAAVNLQFNHDLQAGRTVPVDLSTTTSDHYGKFRSWGELVTVNGPFDEPSFCFADGNIYLQGSLANQAIASFARVRELEPDYLPGLLSLGEVYVFAHRPALALDALKQPLEHPEHFSLTALNSTALDVIAASAFIQSTNLSRGVALLEKEIANHPGDDNLLTAATHVYLAQGLYTNALRVIRLKLATATNDQTWLFNLGYTYMRLNDYGQAIAALTRVIDLNPNNNDALMNRAVAYLNAGRLNAAHADYEQLQKSYPKSTLIAYGLGDIAWRQHATNEAVRNFTIYLAHAPTNTAEFKLVGRRLAELKGSAH